MLGAAAAGAIPASVRRSLPLLFATAAFSSAVLVFLVQPMVARMLLPLLGGTPGVWNTCMVFYQAVLLGGYLYAHLLTHHARPARAVMIHCLVLALPLAVLPMAVPRGAAPPAGTPVPWLLGLLAVVAGLPFFVVSTTAPLLQRWLSAVDHPGARDPYWLYAASNAGSLLALLGYPFLVEPLVGLAGQTRLWTVGYCCFALATTACAVLALRSRRAEPVAQPARPLTGLSRGMRARWVFLAFVPSSLMLGVTQHLSTDVAAVPLLWVVPLALYLLTFIFAFARGGARLSRLGARWFPAVAIAAALCFQTGTGRPMVVAIPIHLALLFLAGQLCHGRLGEERPAPEHLTAFYLFMALGGVLGGIFNALVAPLVFDGVYEYPVAVLLACLARPAPSRNAPGPLSFARELFPALLLIPLYFVPLVIVPGRLWGIVPQGLVLVPPAFLAHLFAKKRIRFAASLAVLVMLALFAVRWSDPPLRTDRSFFGVQTVKAVGDTHLLIHGNIIHGVQNRRPELRREPLSYYVRGGPLSQVLDACAARGRLDRLAVAVVGLGTGSTAAYGRRGQELTFYEIDPATIRIAQDPSLFSFLADTEATTRIVRGDGRLELTRAQDGSYDLIVVDAFSSDAIPVHLLTREAVAMYVTKLRRGGLLLVHISNRYFRLAPVLGAIAAERGLYALVNDHSPDQEQRAKGGMETQWAVLAVRADDLAPLRALAGWQPLEARPGDPLWTDDDSNVLAVFRWWTSAF